MCLAYMSQFDHLDTLEGNKKRKVERKKSFGRRFHLSHIISFYSVKLPSLCVHCFTEEQEIQNQLEREEK